CTSVTVASTLSFPTANGQIQSLKYPRWQQAKSECEKDSTTFAPAGQKKKEDISSSFSLFISARMSR
ncbi:TPA: hypothetical protein ACRTTK_001779, partial [Aeromonas hydrophila]